MINIAIFDKPVDNFSINFLGSNQYDVLRPLRAKSKERRRDKILFGRIKMK